MRLFLFLVSSITANVYFAQIEYNLLFNETDSTKKIKIKAIKSLWFEDSLLAYRDDMNFFKPPFEREIYNDLWELTLFPDTLNNAWLNNYSMHGTYLYNTNGRPSRQILYDVRSYGGDGFGEYYNYRTDEIVAITVENRLKNWMKFGAWTGLLSSLVIAPLVYYDFRRREMNSRRYNTWMLFSLAEMTTFFTVSLFLKDRTFRIKPVYDGQVCWKLGVDN